MVLKIDCPVETSDAFDEGAGAGAELVVGAGAAGGLVSVAGGAVFAGGGVLLLVVELTVSVTVGPVTLLFDGARFAGAFFTSAVAVFVGVEGAVTGAVDMTEPVEPVVAVVSVTVPVVSVAGGVVVTVAVVSLLVVFTLSDCLQPAANSNRTEAHKVIVVFIRYLLNPEGEAQFLPISTIE